jgi:hypothetical protein
MGEQAFYRRAVQRLGRKQSDRVFFDLGGGPDEAGRLAEFTFFFVVQAGWPVGSVLAHELFGNPGVRIDELQEARKPHAAVPAKQVFQLAGIDFGLLRLHAEHVSQEVLNDLIVFLNQLGKAITFFGES